MVRQTHHPASYHLYIIVGKREILLSQIGAVIPAPRHQSGLPWRLFLFPNVNSWLKLISLVAEYKVFIRHELPDCHSESFKHPAVSD